MPTIRQINVPGVARVPAFCHATVVGDQVFVSGVLGTKPDSMELVDGGVGAQTGQALRNIETILAACGCSLADMAKVNVYLVDMGAFAEMNAAYLEVIGQDPPGPDHGRMCRAGSGRRGRDRRHRVPAHGWLTDPARVTTPVARLRVTAPPTGITMGA